MLYVLVPASILIALTKKKSNVVFYCLLVFLWILLGWSSGNADYGIHTARFNNYEMFSSFTEILYTLLMRLGNRMGLSYQQFLPIIMAFYVGIIGLLAKKSSKAPGFVIALYLVFPACMDAVQVRYTLAGSVVLLGFYFLLDENGKRNELKYAICVIIATLIHVSTFVFILFIIAKNLNYKRICLYTGVAVALIYLSRVQFLINVISRLPGMGDKINRVLASAANRYTSVNIIKNSLRILLFFSLTMILLYFVRKRVQKVNRDTDISFIEWIGKLNILSLIILPLLSYSVDFYRIQQTLSILIYCALSFYFIPTEIVKRRRYSVSVKNIQFIACCLGFSFVNLYLLVLKNNNINTVFTPFFENNIFFGG